MCNSAVDVAIQKVRKLPSTLCFSIHQYSKRRHSLPAVSQHVTVRLPKRRKRACFTVSTIESGCAFHVPPLQHIVVAAGCDIWGDTSLDWRLSTKLKAFMHPSSVQDPDGRRLRFSALQSEVGQQLLVFCGRRAEERSLWEAL